MVVAYNFRLISIQFSHFVSFFSFFFEFTKFCTNSYSFREILVCGNALNNDASVVKPIPKYQIDILRCYHDANEGKPYKEFFFFSFESFPNYFEQMKK